MRNRKFIAVERNTSSLVVLGNQFFGVVSWKHLVFYFIKSFIVVLFFSLPASAQIKQLVEIDTVAKAV